MHSVYESMLNDKNPYHAYVHLESIGSVCKCENHTLGGRKSKEQSNTWLLNTGGRTSGRTHNPRSRQQRHLRAPSGLSRLSNICTKNIRYFLSFDSLRTRHRSKHGNRGIVSITLRIVALCPIHTTIRQILQISTSKLLQLTVQYTPSLLYERDIS